MTLGLTVTISEARPRLAGDMPVVTGCEKLQKLVIVRLWKCSFSSDERAHPGPSRWHSQAQGGRDGGRRAWLELCCALLESWLLC